MEVQIGVSFVSIENARMNLEAEQDGFDFEKVRANAKGLGTKRCRSDSGRGNGRSANSLLYRTVSRADSPERAK